MSALSDNPTPATLDALKWRCIGPSRGGRVVAVAGDTNDPMTFYFGACAGGIWKTTDGGVYWRNVSDGFLTSSSVGAIAVARSDSNVVYAGMGETTIRLDVSYGDGVYKSTDAGRTWAHIGLRDTKHIGRVLIHPENPDLVYVAALGDIFGSNDARGVYRSKDGGANWERILHRDADTGAIDMAMDTNNPRIMFASMWQTRRNFWNISSGGPGCGLFRSTDGGDTWEEITTARGLPDGALGKIGVAISPVKPGRVWALIEAIDTKTGLYKSDDYGATWSLMSNNRDLMHRPWYYTHVFADTGHEDTVYVTNLSMWKSTDAGVSFSEINTPHGDNHDLWIDPNDSSRMVEGNDGGACVSFNGGLVWSSIYNQLTAQFYRIDMDSHYPYRVFGTQQDNSSIAVPSACVWGAIPLADCSYPGTGESGFIAVKPDDNNIVYCGAVGSSPGGAGALQRYDYRTDQIQLRNVWPEQSTGTAPRDLRYRFAWTYPIVFSPHDTNVLYAAGNHVFRTTNEGMDWEEISPDLSLNDKSRQDHSGGNVTRESAGAEVHATCACVAPSAHRRGEIWATTDDGLVHVTRDDGKTWHNVTPAAMPALAYVGCVEISAHDPDTVYLAATRYKLADYEPYLFRSTDSGRSWQTINGDYPAGEITRVVRADPATPGLLFVGSETGVFFSSNDGANWARMGGGFPVVPVYDLKIKDADLVVGTHGRSFWILDDISPLRALAAGPRQGVIAPRETVRTKLHFAALNGVRQNIAFNLAFGIEGGIAVVDMPDGSKRREHLDVGENPPTGAITYYWLDSADAGPVVLTFQDAKGAAIARFASDDQDLPAPRRPTTKAGINRFIWDMKYTGPVKIDAALAPVRQKPLSAEPENPSGPSIAPGSYLVEASIAGTLTSAGFTVVKDPRLSTTDAEYAAQLEQLQALTASLSAVHQSVNLIRRLKVTLAALANRDDATTLADKARAGVAALSAIEGVLVDVKRQSARDGLRNPAGLADTLGNLAAAIAIADCAPTSSMKAVAKGTMGKVSGEIDKLEAFIAGELADINAAAGNLPLIGL